MQFDQQWPDQILARFMRLSRLHLGLVRAPVAASPPRRISGPSRHILRSLIVAGSLSALFGSPVFATESSRPADPAKRGDSADSKRTKADERQDLSHKPPLSGKHRQ